MKLHDDIHNYYEKLVLDEIIKQNETHQKDGNIPPGPTYLMFTL